MKRRRWLWVGGIVLLACAAWLAYPRVAFPIQALCWKYKSGMAMVHQGPESSRPTPNFTASSAIRVVQNLCEAFRAREHD